MPLDNDKLKKVYATLKKGGYREDYNTFIKGFTGNENYQNRKKVYDLLTENGAKIGNTYEDFMRIMQVSKPAQATPTAKKQTPASANKPAGKLASNQPKTDVHINLNVPRLTLQQNLDAQMPLPSTTSVMDKYKGGLGNRTGNVQNGNGTTNIIEQNTKALSDLAKTGFKGRSFETWKNSTPFWREHEIAVPESPRSQVNRLADEIDRALDDAKGRAIQQSYDFTMEHPILAGLLAYNGAAPGEGIHSAYQFYARSNGIPVEGAKELNIEILDLEAAQRAMRDARRTIAEADHNAQKGTFGKWLESSFAGGAVRGAGQRLFDVDTWDFGVSDLSNAGALMSALIAFDKGKELTKSQQMLLDAKAVELATDAYFGSHVGYGYKAGKVTAESVPFMLEMCINPASASGHKATSIMTRYALKRFGKQAVRRNIKKFAFAKAGARVAGDVLGAATMTATTGSVRTAANAVERMNGQVEFSTDENGKSVFSGHTEGDDAVTAIGKAFASTTIENYSEMVGEYFAPVLNSVGKSFTKGLGKITPSSVENFINGVSKSDVAKLVGDFEKHAKWHGTIGEYAEELSGGIMNALVVGDQTLDADPETGVFNLEKNIETFLGVSLLGGFMSGVKTAGYRTPKYRAKQEMKKADDAALQSFGGNQEAWGAIRNTIAFGNEEEVNAVLLNSVVNPNLSREQVQSVFTYTNAVENYKGILKGNEKNKKEDEKKQGKQNVNYKNGENNHSDQEDDNDADLVKVDVVQVARKYGYDASDEERRDIAIEASISDDAEAQEAWNGVVQHINDDADNIVAQHREEYKRIRHKDGSVRPAFLKEKDSEGKEQRVYIVDGHVQLTADGSAIDKEASDKSVVIYNPATGKREQIDPSSSTGLANLLLPTTADEYEANIQAERSDYVKSQLDKANGKLNLKPGERVVMPNGEEATITEIYEDGGIFASTDDGRILTSTIDELQRIADEKALADYRQRHGIKEPSETGQPEVGQPEVVQPEAGKPDQNGFVSGAPADYTAGMKLTIREEDGSEKQVLVSARVKAVNRNGTIDYVPEENGPFVEYYVHGEKDPRRERPGTLNEKVVSHFAPQQPEAAPVPQYSLNDDVYLRTEDGEIHGNVIAEENPDGLITIQSEQPIGGRIVNQFTREQLDGMTGNNAVENPAPAETPAPTTSETPSPAPAQHPATAENPAPAETPAPAPQPENGQESNQPLEPMPMVKVRGKMKPDWDKATPARAHAYLYNERGLSRENANAFVENNRKASASELEKLRKKKPEMGTDLDEFEEKTAEWQSKMDEAQRLLDYWNDVREIQNAIQRKENDRRAAEEAARHEKAVAQAQSDFEERKKAEEERKAVGNENPMPAITEKWNSSVKIDGHNDEVVLPNGETIKGHYVLHESGASSPSHDPETWQKTEGFPMDANDNSVNDRDYERDNDAQQHTQSIARNYDQRALQNVPVVSKDGVVLSGNGRTMAGQLAARDNTDAAYVNYLKEYAHKFGFTPEQVEGMQHPRVSFVPDEAMPYTAETFAKFNQQDMKSQNKTEQAVKLGKTVGDDVFKGIVRTINGYETLGDFYNDDNASLGAVYDLHRAGVIPQAQLAEMVDGVRGQEKLSAIGREFLENMLIGKAFAANPDVVRMLTSEPFMRKAIITALGEIADNIAIGRGYSLQQELADAVKLCFDARKEGAKQGDIVSIYAKQGVLFADPDQLQTVADFNNATMLMLADVLNDKRVTLLKITLQLYNNDARESAAGQTDLFAGGIRSREAILRDVINFIRKNYGKGKEIEAARAAAVERRKAESIQQNGTDEAGIGGSENTGGSGRNETAVSAGLRITDPRTMSDEERQRRGEMLRNATAIDVEPNHIVSTKDKTARKAAEEWWDDNVGDAQWYETEAGEVEINRNSIESSLAHGYGQMKLDAITSLIDGFSNAVYLGTMPDSTRQDGVLNHYFAYPINYKGKRSYVFCRALHDNNTNRLYVHEVFVEDKIKKGNTLQTAASQPHGGISLYRDILANVLLSDGKESENPASDQAKGEKVAENQSSSGVQAALAAAEQETNTEPTEAQKEAGNYKKGHVKIDGYDVTIENPKGSVRRGTDASGKQWEQEMQNTYGYIRGTEGVDGDHIDVFFSEDPSQGDVFVVDQVNKDGTFDEHKVLYGFPDIESARKAYLANYEDGWTGLGAITPVSKEEFKKWVQSSHRKTKPFADYKNVKKLTEDVDQRRTNVNEDGLVVDAEGNPLTLYHGTPNDVEFSSLESGHVRDGEELPSRFNGNGVSFTPERIVATEYAMSGDSEGKVFAAQIILKKPYFIVGVSNFRPEEASAFTEKLISQGYDGIINYASEASRELGALPNEVIVFDIKSANQVETPKEKESKKDNGTENAQQNEKEPANQPATSKEKIGGNTRPVSEAMAIGVEDVASFPKEIREEDTISKEQNSGKRGDRIKVKAGLSGNDLYIQYKSGRSSKDKRRWATIKIPNATNYSAGQIIYRLGYIGTFTDIERLSGDAVLELFNKNGLRLQKGGVKDVSHREAALRDALVDVLRGAGVEVVTDAQEGQRVLDEANSGARMQAKKRALETVSSSRDERYQQTVVSSADGAKVLNNLDKLVSDYEENEKTHEKTFVGKVANAIGAKSHNSKSEYATFETKNGRVVTIRLADHNATVSNFDNRGELDGISIVVSPKKSAGVTNDGDAHVVEYYYDAIKLRKADGKPLADIVRSIKQALYSGEFEDTTGLAERQEVNGRELMKLGGLKMQKKPMAAEDQKHKETQLSIINDTNPAPDDYHTWVRSIDDILTLQEAVDAVLSEDPEYELSTYPDVSDDIIREALRTGRITIYSSKPIKNGVFVTPSMMQAMDYSGGTKVFSKEVPIRDVAWINTDEGQYTATSGEATSKDKEVRFFRTPDGHAYGFTKDGKIYIDQRIATAETPIHEYSHLWASAFRKANPKEWANIVELMKGTTLWEEVKQRYPELKTEDEIADEVLAHYSGRRGAERLRAEREKIANGEGDVVEKAKAISALERVKDALKRFWKGVADWLGIHFTSAEEVAEKVLADMLNGVNPAAEAGAQRGGVRYEANSEEADIVARAKADGTYMKAPNGKPSLLSQRQWIQVRTRSFKEWFGDWENDPNGASKVLDENGEPKVVLHGTPNTFTAFDKRKIGSSNDPGWLGSGFYFYGNNEDYARSYSRGGNLMELFLNIRDPYYASYSEMERLAEANNREASDEFREMVEDEGCDGVYYNADINEEWVAFEPSQIKSATDNVGTFDGSNPDIRYQFVGEKGAAAMDKAEEASVRLDNLSVARGMEAAGKDAKAVKLATGWERGADGKWRYEIEDFDNSGLERVVREDNQRKLRLSEQRRSLLARKREMESEIFPDRYFDEFSDAERHQWYMEHSAEIAELEDLSKEIDRLKKQENFSDIITDLGTVIGKDHVLLKYYPELEGFVVHITYMPYNVGGHYGLDVITLNREAMYDRNTLNHEVQHAIQEIEGFARGGSVRDVRNRIMKRIAELDNVSEHAKEMLARQVEYRALAYKLGYVYERLMKNGEDWAVRAASDNYWEAMNTLDNDENSQLNNVYPKGKNASEIAKEGFNRDKAVEELNRLSDYYASQISADDMKDIKESESLSDKIDGKSDEELYHALGGEVEARNVQSRLGMTAEERSRSLASETEDVAREDQIFLEDGLGVSMSDSASETDLEDVNRRFNDELGRLTEENKDKVVLSLGRPSAVLLSAGVEDKPMKLYGNKVMKKMKKHGFALDELKNLPRAVADPIAVFDNYQLDGNRTVLTELQSKGKNIMIAVTLGKDGVDVDFNIVSSVFGKGEDNIVDWLNKGYARYINKEKALNYLHHSDRHISEALSNPRLVSAAKVVEGFENPKVSDENVSEDDAVYRIREDVQDSEQNDADMMRSVAEQMGEKLHTNIHIIEDVNEITHPNSAVQERRRRSKGWYDTKTGQVNIVLPNNRSVDDVKASVAHETIAHKGLRELIGEENYDAFLDEVYEHLRGDLKQQIDTQASRAFIDDATRNGERAKSYEKHRRTAVDELFGRLAEKPFEEFSEGERTLWQKIKEAVRKVLDEFLGTLKLPKWFELGDNELRYMLWRSKERLERGREHPIDLARDIVKREELGLTDEARYNMGDAPETFNARQRQAVENKGTVMPGLNDAQVKVVDVPRHHYTGNIADATRQAIEAAKAKFAPNGKAKTLRYDNFGATFDYTISGSAVEESLNPKQQAKSANKGVHIAMAEHLDEIIGQSIEVEEHPDYLKNEKGERDTSIINDKALMHRFYGAVVVDGVPYRVMTLMREEKNPIVGNGIHAYEVQKIEVLDETPNTPNGVGSHPQSEIGSSYPLAKLLQNVGKSYEKDKNLLDESKLADESADLYRDGDFTPRDRAIARDTYERMVSTGGYLFQESVQDSMLGLKRLYQSILGKGTRIEDVDGFENAYLAENRMSSVNAAEQHEYYVRYMKPLLKAISDIVGSNNAKRLELTDYMIAKHGLERNVVMAQRDFDAYKQQYPYGTKTLDDFRERDYAGLTALTGEDDVAMAELAAQQMVDTYEQDHDTSELWQRVNDATSATLAKIYNSGLLSKERYEQIQKMFEYYIPLQGWDETTSDEVYGYLTSKNGPLGGSPIKHAKGRSSKADDPIATIALMADDAIRQGNRNKMKQTFLTFVLNHQSDLVSVNDLWLQYNAALDEWEPVFADIENTDTAADVERKVEAFEERMQQLAESDPDNYKRGRDAQNIPYKVVKGNLKEHQVLVRRNGRTYVLTINGNPRAAQALNGLTNPDVETGGVVGNLLQGAEWLNRNLSALYTTRNPDFVASNFFRDMLYSNCMTWVKESPKYALRFHKNFGRMNPVRMRMLLGKWNDGTLDESNYIENLFKQFMLNGGETGYTNIIDIDGHKREIASELKRNGSNARKAWQWLGDQLDLLNGSAENCARFAAFVTSREEGRSIERSIYDAKEISVNFNKKGSGGKMLGKKGQERPYLRLLLNPKTYFNKTDRTELIAQTGSYVGGGGRLLYVFWNAGIQGTTNFARAAKRNPIKATAGAASMFMLGAVIPLLAQAMGGDDDDDKNAYYNLPEYVRRSNIIINAGNQWISIPLPIEFRAFYGLGELATGVITGNERYSDSELAFQIGSQVSQILPLDVLEGGGGINAFVPSIAKPFVEAYIRNKGWSGLPIYKNSPWNKNDPEWTKAYKSTNTYLVSGAKWLNEISGGDDYKKGYIDINPAKVEYMLSGYFGGAFTTVDKLVKMGETIFSDREFDWRNMLIANRLVKTGDERTANRKLTNEYFKYKEEYEETKRLLKKYSDAAATNEIYKHRLERLKQSEDYLLYDVFDNYQPILKSLHDAKDGADEATLKSIENEENALRRDMVDLMHAIEDDKKPDINAHVDAMLKREFEARGRTQKPAGSRIAKRLGGTDSYGSPQNEYGQVYLQMRDYVDLADDVMLQVALKNAKESGDTDRVKAIESARRQITEVKKDLTEVPYTLSDGTEVTAKDIMQELRDLRKNILSELGITTHSATQ